MSGTSSIEWTDATWNPVTGCSRVSPGCAHCYALELAPRLRAMGVQRYIDANDGGRGSGPAFGVTLHPDVLEQPLRWRKPRRVFVNSMSDLFHDEIPEAFVERVFEIMWRCPQHTFQVLTKRPERMAEVVARIYESQRRVHKEPALVPLPNVWLGVSIENRRYVDRADVLRDTPAAVRFISAEPLLGPLVAGIERWRDVDGHVGFRGRDDEAIPELDLAGIDWLIVGGESGARHRPMDLQWARDLSHAAMLAGTAFFFKQVGGRTPKAGGRELDGRTWDQLPAAARAAA